MTRDIPNILEGNDEVIFTFEQFLEMRRKIKKPATDYAITLLMRRLSRLAGGDPERAIEILERSIVNSWTDIYTLKDESKTSIDDHIKANAQAKRL